MSEQENESTSDFGGVFWVIIILAVCLAGWISLPNLIDSYHVSSHGSPANACINNLRQIDAAANEFALEHHLTNGDAINFPNDLTNYIKLNRFGKIPPCPSGGFYTLKKVGENPTCSLGKTNPNHVLP
jgi:hypothetical protein